MTIGIAVIGYGYWGPNLARNFCDTPGACLVAVADRDSSRRALAALRHPSVKTFTGLDEVLALREVDAVVIATPCASHFQLCRTALEAGRDVLVTKPMTMTSAEAQTLVALAEKFGRVLMVDHTFVYTGAVCKIHELVESGRLGQLLYYDSIRVNLGLFQYDVNVLWDLAAHDLAIMDFVADKPVRAVSATGMAHVAGQPENMAYLTCFFDDSFVAHIHANWLSPVKVRRTLIGGDRHMIVYDELEPSEKVKVYDRGVEINGNPMDVYQMRVGYRTGDMWAPRLDLTEALKVEAAHFTDCVSHRTRPHTDGQAGMRVVRVLEAASRSLAVRGSPIEIPA